VLRVSRDSPRTIDSQLRGHMDNGPRQQRSPPNGPLPQFMAVIVQTDPGYQPDPGHPGTGAVVKQLC